MKLVAMEKCCRLPIATMEKRKTKATKAPILVKTEYRVSFLEVTSSLVCP